MSNAPTTTYPETKIYKFVQTCKKLAKRALPAYSCKYSKETYTLQQHAVACCLMVRENWEYREAEEKLIEMPRIRKEIGYEQVPHFTTFQKFFDRMKAAIWRVFLQLTASYIGKTGNTALDATHFDRRHASRHYTKRTEITIQTLKATLLIDTEKLSITDIHITTTRKHDTKIAPQLIKRSKDVQRLYGDKGYDDSKLRKQCQNNGIKPIIPWRNMTGLENLANQRLKDEENYHQRSMSETINHMIKRNYNYKTTSRTWYRQFREIIVMCVVHNIDRTVKTSSKTLYKIRISRLKITEFRRISTEPFIVKYQLSFIKKY